MSRPSPRRSPAQGRARSAEILAPEARGPQDADAGGPAARAAGPAVRGAAPEAPRQAARRQGYDYDHCRRACRRRGIVPRIARRGVESTTPGPPPLGGRAHAGLVRALPAAHRPPRAPARRPARVPPARRRPDLPQVRRAVVLPEHVHALTSPGEPPAPAAARPAYHQLVHAPVQRLRLLRRLLELAHEVARARARHHERLAQEDVPLLAHPHLRVRYPVHAPEQVAHLARQALPVGLVALLRPAVDEVHDRHLQVRGPVLQDVEGDQGRGERVEPPQAEARPDHADGGRDPRHPVRLHHLGVGVQHLVVQARREPRLGSPEQGRGDRAVGDRGQHRPAGPDHRAEQVEAADGRLLAREDLRRRVGQQEQAHPAERERGDEVGDRGRAVGAVGVVRPRRPARQRRCRPGRPPPGRG